MFIPSNNPGNMKKKIIPKPKFFFNISCYFFSDNLKMKKQFSEILLII
jgi:hypothetical protein